MSNDASTNTWLPDTTGGPGVIHLRPDEPETELTHEEKQVELLNRVALLKRTLTPDADILRKLRTTASGCIDLRRIQTEAILETAFQELCTIYTEVLALAHDAGTPGTLPEQPDANWLHARAGSYCTELSKFCELLSFTPSPLRRETANVTDSNCGIAGQGAGRSPASENADALAKLSEILQPPPSNIGLSEAELSAKVSVLSKPAKKAYLQFHRATRDVGYATDKAIWDWLKASDSHSEGLPKFETWVRNLRDARAAFGEQLNESRVTAARKGARSAVREDGSPSSTTD